MKDPYKKIFNPEINKLTKYQAQRRLERALSVGRAIKKSCEEQLEKDKRMRPECSGAYYESQRHDAGYIAGLKCILELMESDPDRD